MKTCKCGCENADEAKYCRNCGKKFAKENTIVQWWELYDLVPVSTFRLIKSHAYLSNLLFLFSLVCLLIGIMAMSIAQKEELFILGVVFITISFSSFIIRKQSLRCYRKPDKVRKERKELLDTDFIEYHESHDAHYVIVARGTEKSHKMGIFDTWRVKMIVPFQYDELKWKKNNWELLNVKNEGELFTIDTNGNEFH